MEGIRQDTRLVVDQMQRQVARLKAGLWFLLLLMLGGAGFLAWQHFHPQAAPMIQRVGALTIVDEHGQVRMLLTPSGIRISDDQGRVRADLSLKEDGSGQLILNDAQGTRALAATAGSLSLSNAKKDGAVLTTVPAPTLQLRRADKVVVKQPWDAQDLK